MSFERDGFLSGAVTKQARSIRQAHTEWISLARSLNRIGQKIVITQREIETNRGLADYRAVSIAFYTRALSSFQAAILLAQKGMIIEANTIIRSLIETTWILAGLTKEKDNFVQKLAEADYAERKASSQWYLNNPSVMKHVKPASKVKLREFITSVERADAPLKKLIFGNVAATTGLVDLYAFYRHLSHHYAHPSITAVSIFTISGPKKNDRNLFWNSEYGLAHVSETFTYACMAMIGASVAMNDTLSTPRVGHRLGRIFEKYRLLADATAKENRAARKKR